MFRFVQKPLHAALLLAILAAASLAAVGVPASASAETPDIVYFPETGHHVPARFFDVWKQYDLAIIGYPISEVVEQDGRETQFFERAIFQYFPEHEGTKYEVQLKLLGNLIAGDRTDPPFQPSPEPTNPGSMYFPETSHSLDGTFRDFWERYGGLYVFGFPISEPFDENGRLVQYFERARFEYWPEHEGTRYEVQLGLLGHDAAQAAGIPTASVPRQEGVPDWSYDPEPRAFHIPILMYHHFGSPESRYQVSYERFDQQLDWLQENGYTPITLPVLYDAIYKEGWLPEKPVVLTFDDGLQSQWTAAHLLDEHGMKGVFFISYDSPTPLRDDQIVDLHLRGHEIESHTFSHPFLTQTSDEALTHEIAGSRQYLRDLGVGPVDFFAYPFGDYNQRVINAVVNAGYRGAMAAWGGTWIAPEKRWTQPRIEIDGGISIQEFANYVTTFGLSDHISLTAH